MGQIKPLRERLENSGGGNLLLAVVADGLDRTALEGLHAKLGILFRRRLGVDEGITALFVALEKCGSSLTAKITIDALLVHVEFTTGVVLPLFCFVGHLL
jgi:hypothetical protein